MPRCRSAPLLCACSASLFPLAAALHAGDNSRMRVLISALLVACAFSGTALAAVDAPADSGAPASRAAPPAPDPGKWQLALERSADGVALVTATLPAEAPIPSGFDQVTPKLVLRYRAGRTSAYVLFDTFLGRGSLDAEAHFGREPAETRVWRIASDGRAVFVPGDALAFIDRLKRADTFSLHVVRRTGAPFTASFSTTGIDVVIKALLSAGVKYSR